MKVLMLSTDRKLLEPGSAVAVRTQAYAARLGSITIILAGVGERRECQIDERVKVIFPGGTFKAVNFFTMLVTACTAARTEKPDIVSLQDPFFVGVVGVAASFFAGAPLQVQVHTNYFSRAFIFESFRHMVQFCLAVIVLPFATCVRVVTHELGRSVRPYTSAPIAVLPIYADISRVHHRHPKPEEFNAHPIVLTVSRLAKEKRIDMVIRSLIRLPEVHLYILGDGAERQYLADEANTYGVSERVHFLGWRDDPTPYYTHADCFVQMSSYEGYGVALVEALAAGVPIVATDVGIVSELPVGCVTIVEGHEYSLARALSTTLDSIAETRRQQREARTSFLHTLLTEEQYVAEYSNQLTTCAS